LHTEVPLSVRPQLQHAVAAPVRLSDLAPGRRARLLKASLAPQDCALLSALGMTDRCVLRICKVGEPCIVQVQSTRIGLSRAVADGIMVVPEAG
jgi:Fe2+ transport system protein FeoA